MNGNKKPILHLMEISEDSGIDPVTGLTSTPSRNKKPINVNQLAIVADVLGTSQQDVGHYFDRDSKFDINVTAGDLEDLERERALKQSTGGKLFNAVVGGISSGVLTAIQGVGYLFDFENNIKRIAGLEYAEDNALTSLMKKGKEGIDKIMPVHRYNKYKTFDWSDPGFYFSALKGVLDSAIGFAIPGMAVTKGIGLLTKAAKATAYLNFLKTSKTAEQIINATASGYLTNFIEGKTMAVELFENSMFTLKAGLIDSIFDKLKKLNPDIPDDVLYRMAEEDAVRQLDSGLEDEFRTIAGTEANKFINRNRINMLSDMIALYGIHKGVGFTRNLIKEKGFSAAMKRLGTFSSDNLLLQAGREALEEIEQNVLQLEGEYQAAKRGGINVSDTPENLLDRVYEFATSDQALLEGMMGFFGGGPQRLLTEGLSGNLSKSAKERKLKEYQDQQEQIKKNTEYLNTKLGNYAKAQALRAEAIATGNDNVDEVIKNLQFLTLAAENFVRGTTEQLERNLKDIAAGVTKEEQVANGWDENYQKQANELLDVLKKLEKSYLRNSRYENQADVFLNRETRNLIDQDRQKIEKLYNDIKVKLEEDPEKKDPELLKEMSRYEKMLKRSLEKIKELDEEYKDLTSDKTQKAIKKQKDELVKKATEVGKKLKEERKRKIQEEAAKKRREKNEKKTKIKNEKTSDSSTKQQTTPDTKQQTTSDNKKKTKASKKKSALDKDNILKSVKEEDEDTGPDISVLSEDDVDNIDDIDDVEDDFPDVDDPRLRDLSPDEAVELTKEKKLNKQKRKNAKKQFGVTSEGLFDDFEKDSDSATPPNEMSSLQKRVGLLETMMKEAARYKNKKDIDFDELIEMLIDHHGRERVEKFFNMIQGLWIQKHPGFKFFESLDDYLELNSDEKKELNAIKKEARTITSGQFTNSTVKEIEEEFDDIEKEIAKQESSSPFSFELHYHTVESGSGILAYLSRAYKQTKKFFNVYRTDVDNYVNEELQDKGILDPDKYPVGTKVTLVVEDDDNTKVYIDSATTREKTRTTWGAKKASWKARKIHGESERYQELYEEEVPIAVYANGKKIGYLHETSWINPMNVHFNVESDRKRSKKIRKHIVAKGKFETVISRRTNGYLWRVANKEFITTSEALPDSNLPILVVKNGSLHTSRTKLYSGKLINKSNLKEGRTYIVIPTAGGPLAVPLMNKKLFENPNIAKTIRRVLEIYMTNDKSPEAQAIINEVFNTTGKNITTAIGLSEFINMFIHFTDVGKGTLSRETTALEEFLIKNTTVEQSKDGFATSFIRDGGEDLQFETALGKGIRPASISRKSIALLSEEKRKAIFDRIEENLNAMFINVSLDAIGDENKNIFILDEPSKSYKEHIRSMTKSAFLGHNIAEEGQPPKYIYNVQPVIEMDFSEIDGNDSQTGKPIIGKETAKTLDEKPKTTKVEEEEAKKKTQEEKPKYDDDYEGDMDFMSNLFEESLAPEFITPLTEEEVEEIEELSEVEELEKDEVRGVIISAFGSVAKQNQVTDYIRSRIIDKIFKKERVSRKKAFKEVKMLFVNNLNKLKSNLAIATKADDKVAIEHYTKAIEEINLILNNWNKLERLTIKELNRIDNIRIIEDNDDLIEEEELQNETAHYSEASAFITPPTDRLAPQIKQFLSGIGKWREDPNEKGKFIPDKNYFGAQKSMDFWDVYNVLQRLTANTKPSYEEMIRILKEYNSAFPFLNEVITKLENAPQQLRNQFVSGMTNHNIDMKFIQFGRNDSGAFELKEFDADSNAIQRVVLNDWNKKAIERIGVLNPEGDDVLMDDKLADILVATWKRFQTTNKYTRDEIAEWFYQIGIELTEQTWKNIEEGRFKYKGKVITLRSFVEHTIMRVIANHLKTAGNTSLVLGGNRIIDQGVVKALARYDAKYRRHSFSNSYRSGLKTVYSYSLNKFVVNRIRELKENKYLLQRLAKLSFNGESSWLKSLMDDESGFGENFSHWTVSLEALKKAGSKSRNNREMDKLSDAEIELVKIGMLQADREDLSGKNQRIIKVIYPTTSDKTTVIGLNVVAEKLVLTPDGDITDESIDNLVDLTVRPEIQRIRMFQTKVNTNLKGYNKGASQFLMFPELNTLVWKDKDGNLQKMFNEDGNINGDVHSPEAMTAIRNAIKTHFNKLLEEKLKMWEANGIGFNRETGQYQYLHQPFLMGVTAKGANPLSNVNTQAKIKAAATDMIFQYLIANAEIHKLFSGDPAIYYKQSEVNRGKSKTDSDYDFVADAEETYANLNKRLAADIAPGIEIAEAENDMYTQVILKDSPSASLARFEITEILDGKEAAERVRKAWERYQDKKITKSEFMKSVKGLASEKYYEFEGTDAQEYVTWKEHLHVMRQIGEISEEEYKNAYDTLEAGKDLSRELMGKVMQPMKPVYVDNQIDEESDVEKRVYIKTSAFPLFPQLTRNLQIDNLRIALENVDKENGRVRAVFASGIKIGGIDNAADIWDKDGNIIPLDKISFENSKMTLNRKGFRIQQKVPYDPKKSVIHKVTQASKNLFVNILGVDGFVFNGKTYTGAELQKVYHEIYGKLHKIERDKLVEEIGYDEKTGKIANISKLRKMLIDEARERGYPLSDQELVELDKELKFIAFSPSANRYESLLNSIVTNRIVKLKMPGNSFVLGSEEGFKGIFVEDKEQIAKREGIIFTDAYDPKVGLKPSRIEDGVKKPAQAIVPWRFQTKEGKRVSITKYIKDGKIDLNKVPKEILQVFGMRIPNQGLNSQSVIEIVGFLPEITGDLIITTRDFVVQMGSDYDVDKMNIYMYSYYFDNDGNIKVHREVKETNEAEVLKNKIIDIHIAIHKNLSEEVQSQIVAPLGIWKLKELSNDIINLRKKRNSSEKKPLFTGLSDSYQKRKFKEGTAGKSGVGTFSVDNIFNAICQGKNMTFMLDSTQPLRLQIGNKISTGDLSEERTLDKAYYKSEIISGYQSAAVDNAKEPILDKLNVNTHTFKVIKILNQLGFTDEVAYILAQDIIIDYVGELERMSGSMLEFISNREETAFKNVLKKYNVPEDYTESVHGKFAAEEATIENLKSYIELGDKAPNYVYAQVAILNLFRRLNDYGQKLQVLQSTINVDARGVGKSVFESMIKEEQVYQIVNSTSVHIANASALIGDIKTIEHFETDEYEAKGYIIRRRNHIIYAIKPETINGHAIVYGLFTANDMWANLFPYQSLVIEKIFEKIEAISKSSEVRIAQKAERRKDIWNNIKSYLFTKKELGLYTLDITEERKRLLVDEWEKGKEIDPETGYIREYKTKVKDSLGSFLLKVQNTPYLKNNPFISKLTVDVNFTGGATLIKYNASAAENLSETIVYSAFIDMLTRKDENGESPVIGVFNGKEMTLRDLAQELILYAYITGGIQEAVQFVKYIPASYLVTIPFAETLGNTRFTEKEFQFQPNPNRILDYYNVPPFVEQYFQHNPNQVPIIIQDDIVLADSKDVSKLTSFELTPEAEIRIAEPIVLQSSEISLHPPVYVAIYNPKSEKGYNLYKYDYENKHGFASRRYVRIDTLGSFANDEYNANVFSQSSILRRNKVPSTAKQAPVKSKVGNPLNDVVEDSKPPVKKEVKKEVEKATTNYINSIREGTIKLGRRTDGKTVIKEILNEIKLESGNPYYSLLAQEIYDALEILPDSVSVEFTNDPKLLAYGLYIITETPDGKRQPNTLVLNTFKLAKENNIQIAEAIFHELTHALTSLKIKYYWFEKNGDEKKMDALLKASPNLTLSDKERKIIQNIEILRRHYINKITSDPKVKAEFDKFTENLEKQQKGKPVAISKEEIIKFYGLTSISDFVAMALTNPSFAELLNNVLAPNKQESIFQSLIKKLVELFKSITKFKVKEGSVYEQTIYRIFELIEEQKAKPVQTTRQAVKREANMTYSYGNDKRSDVTADTTIEAIKRGERTATTRYDSDGNINYWKMFKEGDEIEFVGSSGERVTVIVTKPLYKLKGSGIIPNEWSKLEGWSVDYFHKKVAPKLDEAWQIQFKLKTESKETADKQVESGVKETPIYVEYGTYYKFKIKNGVPVEGWYSQGNPNNWRPLVPKNMINVYERLTKFATNEDTATKPVRTIDPKTILPENQMRLPDGRIITFNNEQVAALDAIKKWSKSDDKFFTLSGYAGTGKTTIIKKAIDTFLPSSIVVSAPTHKAKRVIQATTGKEGVTIHSLLNIKPNFNIDNLNPNNLEFAIDKRDGKSPKIASYKVVIIDEASMINKTLLKLIITQAEKYNVKVIFMGDLAQIPPVGETMSGVFTNSLIKHKAHLQKVERQADGNPLFAMYDSIRSDISSPTDNFEHETKLNDKGEGAFFTSDRTIFEEKVIEAFGSEKYKVNPNAYKLITYTNRSVSEWNNIIRKAVMPNAKLFIEPGDILMGYRSIGLEGESVENSSDYRVISRSEHKVDSSYGIGYYVVELENTLDNSIIKVNVIDNTEESREYFAEELAKLINAVEKSPQSTKAVMWEKYFKFRNKFVLFEDIVDDYGNLLVSCDLKYGYAITAHKSQGSTYETVFVDENNIDNHVRWDSEKHVLSREKQKLQPLTKEDVDTERNKIKYVAFSRPSKNVVSFSRKTTSEKNTFVKKPIIDVPITGTPDTKTLNIQSVDDWDEVSKHLGSMIKEDTDDENINNIFKDDDDDVPFDVINPKLIVSDEEVDKFMKQCKEF